MMLDLVGIKETDNYKASLFPGGEVYFALKDNFTERVMANRDVYISIRINSADALMTLILAINTIKGRIKDCRITVYLNYMPYQQSDRYIESNGLFECFGLKAVAEILNSLPVSRYVVVDPHSDVTPALLKNCSVMSNVEFIKFVLKHLRFIHRETDWTIKHKLTVLSTDAGAYKKIFKLCAEVDQLDEVIIESANKFRDSKGNLKLKLSTQDFQGRDVLMIDDICLGGRTFIELADELSTRNVGNCYLAVSHGIFNNGFSELAKRFGIIFTTNSWQTAGDISERLSKDGLSDELVRVMALF